MSKKSRFRKALKQVLGDDIYYGMSPTRRSTKKVSERTMKLRRDMLFHRFPNIIYAAGYKPERPENLKEKHIEAVLSYWTSRDIKADTVATYSSCLRYVMNKVGKPHLEKMFADWIAARKQEEDDALRRYIVETGELPSGKSWQAKGIDYREVISLVMEEDSLVALHLSLMGMFGLRLREVNRLRPSRDWNRRSNTLRIHRGPKGGLERTIDFRESHVDLQCANELLEHACQVARRLGGSMMPEEMSEKQWRNHHYGVLHKCGVTKASLGGSSHSFRHERAQRLFEEETGQKAPVLQTGTEAEALLDPASRECIRAGRNVVAEFLGHHRHDITRHYLDGMEKKRMWRYTTTRGHKNLGRRDRGSQTEEDCSTSVSENPSVESEMLPTATQPEYPTKEAPSYGA